MNGLFVYLSPMLELESQWRVDFTVAHEIAHLVLKHHEPENPQMALHGETHQTRPAELAADTLAELWGFKRPKRMGVYDKMLVRAAKEAPKTGRRVPSAAEEAHRSVRVRWWSVGLKKRKWHYGAVLDPYI